MTKSDILLLVTPEDCQASPCFLCKRMHTEIHTVEAISNIIVNLRARCDKHSPGFFLQTCKHYLVQKNEEEME